MRYSRANPSARYRELVTLYARMHVEGEKTLGIPPEKTFPGSSLPPHIARIKMLIDATGARSILDYGSGKGMQYRPQKIVTQGREVAESIAEYWDVDEVRCYDPGFAPYSELPSGTFDGVVCTDVLEHLPEEDLDWVLEEIFGFAKRFVFLNVACFPARKSLPNGANAHVTVRDPQWWQALIAARASAHAGVDWMLCAAYEAAGQIAERVFKKA